MTVNGLEITLVCANLDKTTNSYGDIYTSVDTCCKEHPDDDVIYGFCVISEADAPDWFDTIAEAVAWICKNR